MDPLNAYFEEISKADNSTSKFQNISRDSNSTEAVPSHLNIDFSKSFDSDQSSNKAYAGLYSVGFFINKKDVTTLPARDIGSYLIPRGGYDGNIEDPYVAYGRNYRYSVHVVYVLVRYNPIDLYSYHFIISQDCERIEVATKELVPPLPPQNLSIKKINQESILSWQRSFRTRKIGNRSVKSDDTAATMVYIRNSLFDPYELVSYIKKPNIENFEMPSEIIPGSIITTEIRKNQFNINLSENRSYFIALAEVDVHGNISNLSEQIFVYRDKLRNTFINETISKSGAPRAYPNLYIEESLFKDIIDTDDMQELIIFYSPDLPQYEKSNESYPSYKLQLIDVNSQNSNSIDIHVKPRNN
tara:strand:+ start:57 stop:1127 length:1071 start_codon:yes stop_codon:yes gene_type:complete